nr:pistil-specific extensin-like protein [Ipomoea batatas]
MLVVETDSLSVPLIHTKDSYVTPPRISLRALERLTSYLLADGNTPQSSYSTQSHLRIRYPALKDLSSGFALRSTDFSREPLPDVKDGIDQCATVNSCVSVWSDPQHPNDLTEMDSRAYKLLTNSFHHSLGKMAIFQAKPFILVVFLSSFSVLGHENGGAESWALAPHSLPGIRLRDPSATHPQAAHNNATPLPTSPTQPKTKPTIPHRAPARKPCRQFARHPGYTAVRLPPRSGAPPKAPAAPPPKTHHHHHSPKPPAAPIPPPSKPPTASPPLQRKAIAVRGLVYCKSCQYRGFDNLYKATPLEGAVVKLACNNTKYHLVEKAKTDKNGFFLIMPKTVTSAGFHKCKVFLVASPKPECSVFTNYKFGQAGAPLIPTAPPPELKSPPYVLFTVGPFAFEPSKKAPCPH